MIEKNIVIFNDKDIYWDILKNNFLWEYFKEGYNKVKPQ